MAPLDVDIVATDAFLRTNDDLAAAGLLLQKGFPSTYDVAAMTSFLGDLRAGRPGRVPVYSHATYDRVPGQVRVVRPADVAVVIVEGVNALQPSVAPLLDLRLYVDAEESLVRSWYVERFVGLIDAAQDDPSNFYRRFVHLDDGARRAMAVAVWEGVNLVNLTDHILATREAADVVVAKEVAHAMRVVEGR